MAIIDYALAGSDTFGGFTPEQVFSGEMKIVTKSHLIAAGQVLDKYTVMARNTAGALVPLDTTQTDGRQNAMAILMTPINTTAAAATTPKGVALPANPGGAVDTADECYVGGMFNLDLMVWPAALTTNVSKARQGDGKTLQFQRLL